MTMDAFRDLLDLVSHPSALVDGGRIVAANSVMSAISGYSAQELIGKEVFGLLSAEEFTGPSRRAEGIFRPSTGVSAVALRQRNGEVRRLNMAARPLESDCQSALALYVFEMPSEFPNFSASVPVLDSLPMVCMETAETAIAVICRNGTVAFANRKCCDLLGYQRLEIIGASWLNLFVAMEHRQVAAKYFERVIARTAQLEESYEAPMPTKGGMKRIMKWNGRTLVDHRRTGRILGMVICGSDVTEEKRLSEALEDMQRRYRLVSENVTDAVWTYDLVTRQVTYVGQSIAQIVGFTSQEVIETGLERLFLPRSYELGMRELERQLQIDAGMDKRQRHSWTLELQQLNKKGEVVWVEVTSRIMRDPLDGRPIGITGVTRDITERKNAERVMEESERRYRTLFENSMDAIFIIRRNGDVVDLNRAALDMFGYSRGDTAGLTLDDLMRSPDLAKFKEGIEQRGFVRNFQTTLKRNDGTWIDCVLTFGLRRDEKGNITGYEGSIRDITRYRRLQENLRLYINELTSAQEQERYRLSRELHDGLLQDLLALALRLEEATRTQDHPLGSRLQQLMEMQTEVNRLARETRRVSHALGPGVLEQLGLIAAIRSMVEGLSGSIEAGFEFVGREERLHPDLELALFRMAQEGLNNAKKHSRARAVQVQLRYDPTKVSLTIADDGKGFEVPRRLGDYAAIKKLGLIGMEQRAEILGGSMTVESRPNAGTAVSIQIPRES